MVDFSRQIIIIVITMCIVFFYQFYEDKKNNIKREDMWSMIKMPVLMASIVYLAMNLKMPKTVMSGGGFQMNDLSPDNIYTELPNW